MQLKNWILEYWGLIESKKVLAPMKVLKIYEKLVNQIIHPRGPWIFDPERANRPIEFIETFCRQSKGEWIGQLIKLEIFQKAFVSATYGFVHEDAGERKHKEAVLQVARKNGKSTLLSGLGLYMTSADGEGGAEVYCVATKKDQSRIVFSETVNMVTQSPELSKYIKKRKTDLYMPLTFSKFEPLASDSNTLDGHNSHCVIIDELHAIKDRNLYEVMKQSMSARRQPLLIMITTAGTVRECIYDDIYEYACKVIDGVVEDERFLPVIYELDDREEWTDPKMWIKANPGLGTIKKTSDLAEKVERAKTNPKDLPGILCKDFNIRDTVAGMWLTFDDANNEEAFNIEDFRDCYAVGGVDLSSTTDLTCATLIFMRRGDYKKYVWQQYFLPEELLERRVIEDKIPYDRWHKRGLLTLCEGQKVDYHAVTEWFIQAYREYGIRPLWIGYDSWGSTYWLKEMQETGFEMIEVRQGYKTLSQPMKEMEADLKGKQIVYNNNPVLKWCLTNTAVKVDENGNIKPVKGKNQRQRIDGTVSLLVAYVVLQQKYNEYLALL
jgi:phage terminase large subunit-like protein